jgi:FkbM family methyltransferase
VLNYEDDIVSGEAWLLQRFLKSWLTGIEHPVLFDVGANEGTFTKALCRSFPTARIHSFEAHPKTFQRLVSSTTGLPVKAAHMAVGAECGRVTLFDHARIPAGSEHATVIPSVLQKMYGSDAVSYEVPLGTIDSYCRSNLIDTIDFIKIDIEGNEHAALLGATDMLHRGKIGVIQFEFNQMNLFTKINMENFFTLLCGYDLFRLLPSGLLRLNRKDLFQSNLFLFQNIVALPINSTPLKILPNAATAN